MLISSPADLDRWLEHRWPGPHHYYLNHLRIRAKTHLLQASLIVGLDLPGEFERELRLATKYEARLRALADKKDYHAYVVAAWPHLFEFPEAPC